MPRCKNRRRIQNIPKFNRFGPKGIPIKKNVYLNYEELETIKLIDYKGMNQEECAISMEIARTTVTAIYKEARQKIATALIEGNTIIIEGGNYIVSNEKNTQ